MRTLFIGGVIGVLACALSACGGSSGSSASQQSLEQTADTYAISQIERDFTGSLERALILAKSQEARYLPGWCGPNPP